IIFSQYHRIGYTDAKTFQKMIAGKFVECECRGQHATIGVGDTEHVEISLQCTIFTRCTMDGDIGIVESDGFSVCDETEIVLVDRNGHALVFNLPRCSIDHYFIEVVYGLIKEGKDAGGTFLG